MCGKYYALIRAEEKVFQEKTSAKSTNNIIKLALDLHAQTNPKVTTHPLILSTSSWGGGGAVKRTPIPLVAVQFQILKTLHVYQVNCSLDTKIDISWFAV